MTTGCTFPECSRPATIGRLCGRHNQMRAASVEYRRGMQLKLMRLPEFRVSEPCLQALEVESDRTGKSVYEIARQVIESWVDDRRDERERALAVND